MGACVCHCRGGSTCDCAPLAGARQRRASSSAHSDDMAKFGEGPDPMPRWLGRVLAAIVTFVGPKGIEFAKYSGEGRPPLR